MKKILLLASFLAFMMSFSFGQTPMKLERVIMFTDTISDDGVKLAASSDDAEQENDEIDALFDDDIDAGWEGDPEDQNILTAGLRFRNIDIPRGAIITNAYIQVFSHEGKSTEDVARITIVGQADDNATTFTEDSLISDRNQTMASVLWEVAEEWLIWEPYQTPDLKTIVQEIINRDGWVSGNAMAFFLLGENQGPSDVENAREFESFENISDPADGGDGQNHPERVPKLVIEYMIPVTSNIRLEIPIVVTDTITDDGITFSASSDDAEQENDEIDSLFDDDIDAGWEGDPEDQNILTAGLRFQNIEIPKGATIDSAYILVFSHEGKTTEDVAKISIIGQDDDNASTFTEDSLITDRNKTEANVLWEVAEEWLIWEPYRTPDLKTIVQEIIDRDGWESGNALAFILLGENQGPSDVENAREFESYENIADPADGGDGQNHPERVPRLIIYYTPANSTSTTFASTVEPLKVYPNPSRQEWVNMELASDAPAQIQLFNTNGQLLKIQQVSGVQHIQFHTGKLANGIYLIKAVQEGKTYLQKLIFQN